MAYVDSCQIFTSAQVDSLREGGAILRDCLQYTSGIVRPGISTLELDREAEAFIRARRGIPAFKDYHGFPGSLCTSVNDEVVHGIPSATSLLTEGDIISLDGGVIFDGLYTDACVTVGVGVIAKESQDFLGVVSATLEAVIRDVVRAGVQIGDISSFIEERLKMQGYSPVQALTGHGLGDMLHQFPDVPNVGRVRSGPILPKGTMIAIEPIATMGGHEVYTANDAWTIKTKDGTLACHFEHSVLILEDGAEIVA